MATYQLVPMTAPEGSSDYLPCDESVATRWWLKNVETETGLLFEDHERAKKALTDKDFLEEAFGGEL